MQREGEIFNKHQAFRNKDKKGQHCGRVGKSTACEAGIPCRHEFVSCLLHFQCNSLLMAKFLGPHVMKDLDGGPGS